MESKSVIGLLAAANAGIMFGHTVLAGNRRCYRLRDAHRADDVGSITYRAEGEASPRFRHRCGVAAERAQRWSDRQDPTGKKQKCSLDRLTVKRFRS